MVCSGMWVEVTQWLRRSYWILVLAIDT